MNPTSAKKKIHEINHEFSKVAEFDSNERPLANEYEPNERKKKESMKLIMNSQKLPNSTRTNVR